MSAVWTEQVPLPGRSEAVGDGGAVTAMTEDAARAGAATLERGGNAADAAVAAALAAGVVEPALSGLGGAAYALVFDPERGRTVAFDGSARCPAAAREDLFEPLPEVGGGLYGFPATRDDRSETGPLAVLAPTAPAVLAGIHERFGELPLTQVAEPAIRLAEEGFAPDWVFALHAAAGYRRLRGCPAAFALYTRGDGSPFVPAGDGDRLRLPDLAGSLRLFAAEGAEPFGRGAPARRIVEAVGGILCAEDLRVPAVRVVEPLVCDFRGWSVATLPANSGGPTLAAALAHLAAFPPEGGVRFLHLLAESLRLAFLDRFRYLGDPETAPVPLPGLLDPARLAERRSGVSPDGPRFEAPVEALPSGECTTQVNAVDRDGMAVTLTATLGGRFGAAFAAPGLGYPLNNGMMWFDPRPGRRISPAPHRRALHAAAPVLAFERGSLAAAVGAPGGRRLISAVVLTLARLVEQGASMQEAAGGPGFHADTGAVFLDERTPDCAEVAAGLRRRGHEVRVCRESALTGHFGRSSGIRALRRGGGTTLATGVDPVRSATGIALPAPGS